MAICLSDLGPLLTKSSKKEEVDRVPLIATLSYTALLLVDLQREEALTRRLIFVSNLNPSIKEYLITTKAEEWLCDKDLAETLKTAKLLEKASNDLKRGKKSQSSSSLPKPSTNLKGSPRQRPYRRMEARGRQKHLSAETIQLSEAEFDSINGSVLQKASVNLSMCSSAGRLKHFVSVSKEHVPDRIVLK